MFNTFNGLHLSTMRSTDMFVSERRYIYDGSVLFLFPISASSLFAMNRQEHLRRIAERRETRYYHQNVRRPRIFRDRGNPLNVLNDKEFR